MNIIDFSPNHENKTGLPERIALVANTGSQYTRAIDFCKYLFGACFPNEIKLDYVTARSYYHGNSKLYISCFWNSITGKYELATTTAGIIKTNKSFWKYDFIGLLTDYCKQFDGRRANA